MPQATSRLPERQSLFGCLGVCLDAVDCLPHEAARSSHLGNARTLGEEVPNGSNLLPREARLPAPVGVLFALRVVYAGPLGFLGGLSLGLCPRRHERYEGIPHGHLHGVLGATVKGHAIDDGADHNALCEERPDGLRHVRNQEGQIVKLGCTLPKQKTIELPKEERRLGLPPQRMTSASSNKLYYSVSHHIQ